MELEHWSVRGAREFAQPSTLDRVIKYAVGMLFSLLTPGWLLAETLEVTGVWRIALIHVLTGALIAQWITADRGREKVSKLLDYLEHDGRRT